MFKPYQKFSRTDVFFNQPEYKKGGRRCKCMFSVDYFKILRTFVVFNRNVFTVIMFIKPESPWQTVIV